MNSPVPIILAIQRLLSLLNMVPTELLPILVECLKFAPTTKKLYVSETTREILKDSETWVKSLIKYPKRILFYDIV